MVTDNVKHVNKFSIDRPSFSSKLTKLETTISPNLLEQIKEIKHTNCINNSIVKIGQSCNNNSCKSTFKGPESSEEICFYHPGVPIFHEGMKYWSCCQKKTSDFNLFLEQTGCVNGKHLWALKV